MKEIKTVLFIETLSVVVCLDAVESFPDKPAFAVVYNPPFGRPLSTANMSAFTQTSHIHRLDTQCTVR